MILLFTDGEEAGLLGAAAFVREHPWAKDVGVTLNFEARGTTGRAFMFETGAGNLDVARVLREVPDVSATSLSVTVYRTLPNDTDLSELHALERPALNFAFANGVERYHTTRDNAAHLDPGSVQHEGTQALTLARLFGDGPLPRPRTGDAIFFDMPFVGLVVYPETWAVPLAIATAILVIGVLASLRGYGGRPVRGVVLGVVGTLGATVVGGVVAIAAGMALLAFHGAIRGGGAPAWRGIYSSAVGLLTFSIAGGSWALVRRWAGTREAHAGALVVWTLLSLFVAFVLPGVSFLLVWPLAFTSIASIVRARGAASGAASIALWATTLVSAAIVVPIAFDIGVVLLGVVGAGGVAVALLVALVSWLLAPHYDTLAASAQWVPWLTAAALALALFVIGAATVRFDEEHPAPSLLVYALDADSPNAWLSTPAPLARAESWGALALGSAARLVRRTGDQHAGSASAVQAPPEWLARVLGREIPTLAARVPRVPRGAPELTVLADSSIGSTRHLTFRIKTAPGTLSVGIRSVGAPVVSASVNGRMIDTSRFRTRVVPWALSYTAPPDSSGLTIALVMPSTGNAAFEVAAWSAGLPELTGIHIPPRPGYVVPVQTGNGTVVFRRIAVRAR